MYRKNKVFPSTTDRRKVVSPKPLGLYALKPARRALCSTNLLNVPIPWTGTSPSWQESVNEDGVTVVEDNPPFFEGAHLREGIRGKSIILHSDNGSPMKGATMFSTLQKLGVTPSFIFLDNYRSQYELHMSVKPASPIKYHRVVAWPRYQSVTILCKPP